MSRSTQLWLLDRVPRVVSMFGLLGLIGLAGLIAPDFYRYSALGFLSYTAFFRFFRHFLDSEYGPSPQFMPIIVIALIAAMLGIWLFTINPCLGCLAWLVCLQT
jgi:hypothetical protein